ncbi:hypothetical protein OAK75_13715 [Bacteriovoracales bacterium]|nr:hypothetical protein [Bacteriovoracales bacterium]
MMIFPRANFYLLLSLLLLFGCGSSEEDKVKFAITEAEIHLNTLNCTKAIDVLEEIGAQNKNARYLQTLASAYACKAGFKETTLFTNLGNVQAGGTLLGQFTKFSSASTMTSTDDIDYLNMLAAINTLLYAGGLSTSNNPSPASRISVLGSEAALNINTQLFYLLFDQLGRYGYFYGCYDGLSSGDGDKGKERTSDPVCDNKCFANYTGSVALSGGDDITDYLGTGVTGTCDAVNKGHTSLATEDYNTSQVSILCEGVVLLNNFIEVLDDIGNKVAAFEGFKVVSDMFTTAKSAGTSADITEVMDTLSQTKCEADFGTGDARQKLMKYFVLFYESLFK